ncbi:MAG TPA: SAM hydroxide adenosyltransferase, partial [Terrimicrobiaceae bacterium]
DWPYPVRGNDGWKAEVVHIDIYGNAITAFPEGQADSVKWVILPGGKRIPFERFYAAVPRGNPVAVSGSSGFVEIAINQGDAAAKLGLSRGSQVLLC